MQRERHSMKKINLELTDLKELYDYVSEAIVIVDEKHDIALVDKVALKKFETIEENILYTNIAELIPIDYQEDIFKTIKDSDESYYDIFLKKFNDHSLFPAFVSGQMLQLKDITYGILNIVDITELKKQEEKKLKKLKSHIISQATTHAQKASAIKGQNTTELITLQDELDQDRKSVV